MESKLIEVKINTLLEYRINLRRPYIFPYLNLHHIKMQKGKFVKKIQVCAIPEKSPTW